MATTDHTALPVLSQNDLNRFWSFVDIRTDDECWPWMGGRLPKGYGHFTFRRKAIKAHRLSYFINTGIDPNESIVCHKCDNPPCCNPGHLFAGTHKSNAEDRSAKGRSAFGDKNWTRKYPERIPKGNDHWMAKKPHLIRKGESTGIAKITAEIAKAIRERHVPLVVTARHLAEEFGTTKHIVQDVLRRRTWKHV